MFVTTLLKLLCLVCQTTAAVCEFGSCSLQKWPSVQDLYTLLFKWPPAETHTPTAKHICAHANLLAFIHSGTRHLILHQTISPPLGFAVLKSPSNKWPASVESASRSSAPHLQRPHLAFLNVKKHPRRNGRTGPLINAYSEIAILTCRGQWSRH